MTVTHFNADTLTEEHKTYNTDYIRYHLHYSDSKHPDRLRRLVNEGKIIEYLDNLKMKVGAAISHQVERWKKSDAECQTVVLSGDTQKQIGLENCLIGMERDSV